MDWREVKRHLEHPGPNEQAFIGGLLVVKTETGHSVYWPGLIRDNAAHLKGDEYTVLCVGGFETTITGSSGITQRKELY